MIKLPEFNELLRLATEEPDKLEALRIELSNQVINQAPERQKQRLKGLMFEINAIMATSKPSGYKISELMWTNFIKLNDVLNNKHIKLPQKDAKIISLCYPNINS